MSLWSSCFRTTITLHSSFITRQRACGTVYLTHCIHLPNFTFHHYFVWPMVSCCISLWEQG
jgi:hypothetical protein